MTAILAIAAVAIFALFDFWGFNTIGAGTQTTKSFLGLKFGKDAPGPYRILQGMVGAGILYVLTFCLGEISAALMASILWWTFNADFLYYEFCRHIRWFAWIPANAFEAEVLGDKVTWAWWTPAGLILGRPGNRTKPIGGVLLIVQAIFGFFLVFGLQIILLE